MAGDVVMDFAVLALREEEKRGLSSERWMCCVLRAQKLTFKEQAQFLSSLSARRAGVQTRKKERCRTRRAKSNICFTANPQHKSDVILLCSPDGRH
ncbi:hypothetical protein [Desulfovibrio sp. MES5]|uniref:hypothetical protein n=1 Tax=Desulfovibrio sp. MES5 TaxID=1899016 RepID=UPI0025B84024|nr:hypothetical protein [Desulfovibrio sp. MES5]